MKKRTVHFLMSLLVAVLSLLPTGMKAQTWTASEPAEGTFYLYNVGKEAFVYGANDWDKRASTTQHGGIPVTLVSSSGKYLISTAPLYLGKYFGFNSGKSFVYLDKADVLWEFIAVDGLTNAYIMKATSGSSVRYMVADASGTTTSVSSSQPTSNLGYWQLLTKDQLIANMTENAASDNGVDATWAIQNFYFGYEANTGLWQGADNVVGQNGQPYNKCVEKWNMTSVSLPFDLSIAQVEQSDLNGSIIFGFKDSDASTINFERVNHMDAGKPYLVKLPETQTDNIVNPTFNGVSIIATEGDTEGDDGNVQFIGQIYNKSLIGISNVCYLSTNGYVKKLSATGSIKGLRSYFIVPDVNNVKMTFETPTGIEEINTNENTDIEGAVYDLSGRRVTTPSKGFYIINGKKTFIK